MQYLSKFTKSYCAFLLATMLLTGCVTAEGVPSPSQQSMLDLDTTSIKAMPFDYHVDPENFSITLDINGSNLSVADAMQSRPVTGLKEVNGTTSWSYPSEQISVTVQPMQNFLSISITSDSIKDATFTWPQISADEYYIPLGEGKRIPANDATWKEYLAGEEFSVLEQFSMPFWASAMGDYSVVYIMENQHRSQVNFSENGQLNLSRKPHTQA